MFLASATFFHTKSVLQLQRTVCENRRQVKRRSEKVKANLLPEETPIKTPNLTY